jgi:hypothetical protein
MARQQQEPKRGVTHHVRRAWPFVLMAWRRWDALSPQEKERYKRQAREYVERGRRALQDSRKR